jgi:hypothetical protein
LIPTNLVADREADLGRDAPYWLSQKRQRNLAPVVRETVPGRLAGSLRQTAIEIERVAWLKPAGECSAYFS